MSWEDTVQYCVKSLWDEHRARCNWRAKNVICPHYGNYFLFYSLLCSCSLNCFKTHKGESTWDFEGWRFGMCPPQISVIPFSSKQPNVNITHVVIHSTEWAHDSVRCFRHTHSLVTFVCTDSCEPLKPKEPTSSQSQSHTAGNYEELFPFKK